MELGATHMDMNPESTAHSQRAISSELARLPPSNTLSKEIQQKSRIAVVETIYHQTIGQQPTALPSTRFTRILESDEQPYVREITVGEIEQSSKANAIEQSSKANAEWIKLDTGWIEKVGMLRIINKEGQFLQTKPTEQERKEVLAKIIEVGLELPPLKETRNMFSEPSKEKTVIPLWEIPPLEDCRLTPSPALVPLLRIRCRSGKAKVTLCVFPA